MIRMRVRSDTASENYSWDNFLVNVVPHGAIILMFDDAVSEVYTNVYPYMLSKHMPGTVYAISSLVDTAGYLTTAQLQEIYGSGWDIGNHSSDITNFTTLTQAEIETRLSTCKSFLDAAGMTRASSHVAYPGGGYDADVEAAMVAQSMVTGRLAFAASAFKTFVMPLIYANQINAYEIINTTTIATVKGWIDQAVARKAVTSIFTHKVAASGGNMTISDFEELVDYIVTSGLPVLTISQLWALQSGPLTVYLPY
jgi:peptidoglycan/xylan/chitin deacetylase (PgdA/CDA1 family)